MKISTVFYCCSRIDTIEIILHISSAQCQSATHGIDTIFLESLLLHQMLFRNYSALLKFRPTHLVSPVPKLKYPLIHYPKMEQMAFR
jgi:hypothetical protein